MTVKVLHTVYGFTEIQVKKQLAKPASSVFAIPRPVGMNDLVAIGQRTKYTLNQLGKLNATAKARGFLVLVAYADDEAYSVHRID